MKKTRLKNLNVLITAAGSPGVPGLIKSLRLVDERKFKIIASDMDENAAGLFLADKYYIEPPSSNPQYALKILNICRREKVDVVIPNVGLVTLSKNLKKFEKNEIKVLVSKNTKMLEKVIHKGRLFSFLEENNIPVPEYSEVNNLDEFINAVRSLGYPKKPVCFKPVISEGTRGFRILRPDANRLDFLLKEKPGTPITTLENVVSILSKADNFPNLLVMEYLPGKEYSTDLLLKNGRVVAAVPRYRQITKLGLSIVGMVENNKDVLELSKKVAEISGLDFNINIQIKYSEDGKPKVIEINPRVSGSLVLCTAANVNLAYLGVKALLDEPFSVTPVKYGVKMIRFWSELYINEDGSTYTL
jgi:carbamoyl-phosphate synthase large subunit